MEKPRYDIHSWPEIFANFRNGSVLTEIIKEEEPFIREPYWLSPLSSDQYRCYRTFELEGIKNDLKHSYLEKGPLWDGICKDDVARKYLFLRVVDSPAALSGRNDEISPEEKADMEKAFQMLNLNGDPKSWYTEYYPFARELTHVALLSDPMGSCLERGYRCELIILNLIDNFLGNPTSKQEWDLFYKEMFLKMFGERGIPYVVFTVDFEV